MDKAKRKKNDIDNKIRTDYRSVFLCDFLRKSNHETGAPFPTKRLLNCQQGHGGNWCKPRRSRAELRESEGGGGGRGGDRRAAREGGLREIRGRGVSCRPLDVK